MKKHLLFLLFLLSGCNMASDSTIMNWFEFDESVPSDAATADNSGGYYLAKRGDRYAMAQYNIMPSDYSIVATRAVNKMLLDAPALFATDKSAPLYIADMVQVDRYLPEGSYAAEKAAKDIIHGSAMFNLVTDQAQAKYILQSSITNINTPEFPVIVYRMELYDNQGQKLGSWSDSLRQIQNDDKSWW